MPTQTHLHRLIGFSAVFGGLGVATGAFGAHALKIHLQEIGGFDTWNTAVLYQLLHSLAALAASLGAMIAPAALAHALDRAAKCWLGGVVLFSGSLYALALGGPRLLGPVTPLGGVLFLAGWIMIAITAFRKSPPAE